MLSGVIFDLDGVLIETELETFKFYQERLADFGINLPSGMFHYKAGRKSHDFFNDVLTKEDRGKVDVEALLREKRELFNTRIGYYAKKIPDGKQILEWLNAQGFLLALASQNESRMIESALKWLDIREYFKIILSLEDIKNKKPHPEIYQLALERLGCAKDECIVVEDSRDGVLAAQNAGIFCIQLNHHYMPKEFLNLGNITIESLAEIRQLVTLYKEKGIPRR